MFFYFFESRRDPGKGSSTNHVQSSLMSSLVDDVMMWINGGLISVVGT